MSTPVDRKLHGRRHRGEPHDLDAGDVIDLSGIDADVNTSGNQAFHTVSAFTGHAGEMVVTYFAGPGLTEIALDVTGSGSAQGYIVLDGDQTGFTGYVL